MFRIEVKDTVKSGIYCMGFSGGRGKTFLHDIVYSYSSINKEYIAVTFDHRLDYLKYIRDNIEDAKLIVLDRFDLYACDEIMDIINRYNDGSRLVLVDYKGTLYKFKYCPIKIMSDGNGIIIG